MPKILVTGGAGFIGSNIANQLADDGHHRIVVCDAFGDSEKWQNIAKHMIYEIVSPMDVFYWLEANLEEVEAIVHMGAISSTTETNVDLILENNFSFSKLLWQWCGQHEKRFIYASSAATYGDGAQGFDDELTKEGLAKLKPLNAYGWSKLLFDRFVESTIRNNEPVPAQWAGLRFFNVYGPNEYHKDDQRSVVNKIFPHAKEGLAVQLFKSYHSDYEDGGQLRDFLHVNDCVKVTKWLLNNADVNGLFNVGTGEARSFADLANATFAACNKEPRINFVDMPEEIKPKYQYFTQANMQKLRNAGYTEPFMSLEDGIAQYVQQHLMQDDQYL